MQDKLKEMTDTIRNLTRARAFTIASDLPAKEMTAESLKGTIEKAMGDGDSLQLALIEARATEDVVMASGESAVIVDYLQLRRDVKQIFEQEATSEADQREAEKEASGEVEGRLDGPRSDRLGNTVRDECWDVAHRRVAGRDLWFHRLLGEASGQEVGRPLREVQ